MTTLAIFLATCLTIAGCVWASDRWEFAPLHGWLHRLLGGTSVTWRSR